jgi:hypothetical protein
MFVVDIQLEDGKGHGLEISAGEVFGGFGQKGKIDFGHGRASTGHGFIEGIKG